MAKKYHRARTPEEHRNILNAIDELQKERSHFGVILSERERKHNPKKNDKKIEKKQKKKTKIYSLDRFAMK